MTDTEVPVSLFRVATALVRRRRALLVGGLAGAFAFGALSMIRPAYDAEVSFAPAATSALQGSDLAGLAAQFGFNLSSFGGGQPVEFYSDLVTSRALLAQAVVTPYRFPKTIDSAGAGTDTVETTLLDLYDVNGSTPGERTLNAVKVLAHHMTSDVDVKSGIVTVTVRARWPALASAIAQRVLNLVNEFNVVSMQTSAHAQREFVEGRMREAQGRLSIAEDSLREFLEANRTYQASPRLVVEEGRLQRHVDFWQQIYTSLAQGYEQARIAEVQNTPVITIVDGAEGSAKRVRKPLTMTFAGAFIGLLIGGSWIGLTGFIQRQRIEYPDEYEELYSALKSWVYGIGLNRIRR